METPFAHLEDIQMKLDLEIFPPRGAASKAWSCPSPTTQPLRGGRQSILHLQAAVGNMAWAQAMQWYPWVLTVLLFYCCCVLYPQAILQDPPSLSGILLCQALGWAPGTCRDAPDSTSQPQKGSRSRGGCRNSQQRQMFAREAAEAQREASYPALGRVWSGTASGRC